jgi:hypothetical protein
MIMQIEMADAESWNVLGFYELPTSWREFDGKTSILSPPRYQSINKETNMKSKTLLATAIVFSFAAPAIADEYYVVRGPDRHCTVTTTKPTEQTTVTQIGPLAFESREKAEDRIKTTKVCSDAGTTGTSVDIEKK